MQRLCFLVVLMVLSSSAYAGNSFSFVAAVAAAVPAVFKPAAAATQEVAPPIPITARWR